MTQLSRNNYSDSQTKIQTLVVGESLVLVVSHNVKVSNTKRKYKTEVRNIFVLKKHRRQLKE